MFESFSVMLSVIFQNTYTSWLFTFKYVHALPHIVTADIKVLISRKIYEIALVYISIYNISRQTL